MVKTSTGPVDRDRQGKQQNYSLSNVLTSSASLGKVCLRRSLSPVLPNRWVPAAMENGQNDNTVSFRAVVANGCHLTEIDSKRPIASGSFIPRRRYADGAPPKDV
jgi:hypothetical protein